MGNKGTNPVKQSMEQFRESLLQYFKTTVSLRDVLPITLIHVITKNELFHKKIIHFIENECNDVHKTTEGYSFKIPPSKTSKYNKLEKLESEFKTAREVISNSFIITLICQYDNFIASIMKHILNSRPEMINTLGKKQLTLSDLIQFKTIADFTKYLIDEEVETTMRGSHIEQFKWIEGKVHIIPLIEDKKLLSRFVELTERRNLFVHTNGCISKQYIRICKEYKYEFSESPKEGNYLEITPSYFFESIDLLLEVSSVLVISILKKLFPAENEYISQLGLELSYEALDCEAFSLAQRIIPYVKKNTKCNSAIDMMLTINNILSYYLQNDDEKVVELVNATDWSNCSDLFLMAKYILLKEWKQASKLMEKIGSSSDDIDQQSYHEWPLFSKFRETDEFKNSYRILFEEEFEETLTKNEDSSKADIKKE